MVPRAIPRCNTVKVLFFCRCASDMWTRIDPRARLGDMKGCLGSPSSRHARVQRQITVHFIIDMDCSVLRRSLSCCYRHEDVPLRYPRGICYPLLRLPQHPDHFLDCREKVFRRLKLRLKMVKFDICSFKQSTPDYSPSKIISWRCLLTQLYS